MRDGEGKDSRGRLSLQILYVIRGLSQFFTSNQQIYFIINLRSCKDAFVQNTQFLLFAQKIIIKYLQIAD